MRLMVVDDDVSVCRVLQFILKSMGHDCEWLRHPEGALTSLLSRYDDYDLIFCDYTMPSITGLELVEILKHNNIPNVAIGMSGDAENESHFCSAGVSRFLLKPFDSDDVAKLVDQIL